MYKVFWDAKVLKDLQHIDKLEARRIVSKIEISLRAPMELIKQLYYILVYRIYQLLYSILLPSSY